jgi:hypothetical protein
MDRKTYLKSYLKDYRSRCKCVNLVIPAADYKRLEAAARREGKRPTQLLVEIGLSHLDETVYVPAEIAAEMRTFVFLVRNIANNLNQIAHHTNTVRKAADAGHVFARLKELERRVEDYTTGRLKRRHDRQIHEP